MTDRAAEAGQPGPDAAPQRLSFAARMRRDWWWIAICTLCGGFQIYRGAPVDGIFFLVVAAALFADAAGWLRALDRYPFRHLALGMQLALGLIAVAVITFAPEFGPADLIIVSLIGVTAVVVAWRDDDLLGPSSRTNDALVRRAMRRSAIAWSIGGVALCLWELASFFLAMPSARAEYNHPPLSDLIDPLVATPFGRAICAALWLLGGAMLLQRGRSR
jgi:hypothetical protein